MASQIARRIKARPVMPDTNRMATFNLANTDLKSKGGFWSSRDCSGQIRKKEPPDSFREKYGFVEEVEFREMIQTKRVNKRVLVEYQMVLDEQLGKSESTTMEPVSLSQSISVQSVQFLLESDPKRALSFSYRLLDIMLPSRPKAVSSMILAHERAYDRYLGSVIWPLELAVCWQVKKGLNWKDCFNTQDGLNSTINSEMNLSTKPVADNTEKSAKNKKAGKKGGPNKLISTKKTKGIFSSLKTQNRDILQRCIDAKLLECHPNTQIECDPRWLSSFKDSLTTKSHLNHILWLAIDGRFSTAKLSSAMQSVASILGLSNQVMFYASEQHRSKVLCQTDDNILATIVKTEPSMAESDIRWWLLSAILDDCFELFVVLYRSASEGEETQLKKRKPIYDRSELSNQKLANPIISVQTDMQQNISFKFIERSPEGSTVLQTTFKANNLSINSVIGRLILYSSSRLELIIHRADINLFADTLSMHTDCMAAMIDIITRLWKCHYQISSPTYDTHTNTHAIDLHISDTLSRDDGHSMPVCRMSMPHDIDIDTMMARAMIKAVCIMYQNAK